MIFVNLKDIVHAAEVPELWYQVRKKVDDIRSSLPPGSSVRSSTTSSAIPTRIIYAFTSDGFSQRELRD